MSRLFVWKIRASVRMSAGGRQPAVAADDEQGTCNLTARQLPPRGIEKLH